MTRRSWPGGVGSPAAALEVLSNPDCSDRPRSSKPAYCPWHGRSFREAFPLRCPCSTPHPLETLARMQEAGWAELGKSYADPSADNDRALDLLDQKETCMACLERGLAHPVVRRLRRRGGAVGMSLDREVDRIFAGPRSATPDTGAGNSIRAPIGSKAARNEWAPPWQPIPLSQLGEGAPITWLWDGYLAVGFITLLTGLWKAGKTTLVAHLLRLLGDGGELAGAVKPARVLVVSEENGTLWRRRRDELGIGDHVHLLPRPFNVRPKLALWEGFAEHVGHLVRANGYTLVVFDTVPSVWPVTNENDASEVIGALTPLHGVTDAGAAVLLTHHPRKGDIGEGQASRGSGALPGFVDVIVELRRFAAGERDDRRRSLTAYSRFDETATEVVIELGEDGYRTVGTRGDAKQADRLAAIGQLLTNEPPGMTVDELLTVWPGTGVAKPGRRTAQLDLQHGERTGLWTVSGAGSKGDPHRYRRGDSIRAG